MTVEQQVLSALTTGSPVPTSAGANVFALVLPQGTAEPSITYQRISSAPVADYEGDAGLDGVRMQVDCWGATYEIVKQLGREVRAALAGQAFQSNLVTERDEYEAETKLYRVSQDFLIWGWKDLT